VLLARGESPTLGATAGSSSSAEHTVGQANRGAREPSDGCGSAIAVAPPLAPQSSSVDTLGATAGLSSSSGNTVGQANRATRSWSGEALAPPMPPTQGVGPEDPKPLLTTGS
jgi:hypothetical protein